MSDSLEMATEIFDGYRSRYTRLKELYEKKNLPLTPYSKSPVVKGIPMHSRALVRIIWDWTLHTCGRNSYPENLEHWGNYKDHWTFEGKFTEAQESLIHIEFAAINLDMKMYEEAVEIAKGLWVEYLNEISRLDKNWAENQTGQRGDVLCKISDNYFTIVDKIAYSKEFKTFGSYSNRQKIRAIISDRLLEIFVNKYFICSHFEIHNCLICKEGFYPQTETEWVGRVPPVFCSICLEMGFSGSTEFFRQLDFRPEVRRNNLIEGIKIYVEYFGFIPAVGIQKRRVIAQLYRSGMPASELALAIKVSSLLPFTEAAAKEFGSWAHLLDEAGLLSERKSNRGGYQSIATDGHLCLSLGERAICEHLTRNEITHEKEPMYPYHEKLNPNSLLRGDFLVNGVIIEFAGMMSNPEYASRMEAKQKLAKILKLKWMKLEAASLNDLDKMLEKIKSKV
jgi:hypothetical protein